MEEGSIELTHHTSGTAERQNEEDPHDESLRPVSSSASSTTLASTASPGTIKSARSSSSSLPTESPTTHEKTDHPANQQQESSRQELPRLQRQVTFESETSNTGNASKTHSKGVEHARPGSSTRANRKRRRNTWWRRFSRFPLSNSLATLSLAVAAVGLLFFGWREYRIENSSLYQTFLQNCGTYDEKLETSLCRDLATKFKNGTMNPPYILTKRTVAKIVKVNPQLRKLLLDQPEDHNSTSENWVVFVILFLTVLAAVNFLVTWLKVPNRIQNQLASRRSQRRNSDFLTATNRSLEGLSKASYDGRDYSVLLHRPSSHDDLHKLGHWLRSSASSSSSSVDSSASSEFRRRSSQKRHLSIRHPTKDEEEAYDSLIELPSKKDTKIFFEPNTGSYIRLAPWKSQANDEEQEGEDHHLQEGDTKGALAKMGSGAATFAAGLGLGQRIMEEIVDFEEGKIRQQTLPGDGSSSSVDKKNS